MAYRIKPAYWLKTETDKVEAIILMEENWTKTWEPTTLQEYLKGKGLNYTVQQVEEIGAELLVRGVIEEIV